MSFIEDFKKLQLSTPRLAIIVPTVMFRAVCLQLVQIIDLLHLNLKTLQKALSRAAPQPSFF